MTILVIGSGAREHALLWKMKQSPRAGKFYCAPGNAGIAEIADCVQIAPTDVEALVAFAREKKIDLTVVGTELSLAAGIVDRFEQEGLAIFGPKKNAAELETSKRFAKEFMRRHRIPTAEFQAFSHQEAQAAKAYLSKCNYPVVVKADGLAAGKGVVICEDRAVAMNAIEDMFDRKVFGEAGTEIVIEQFLKGEEVSVFAITDGERYVTLAPAQDHKKIFDGERGKNTGGMGAYAPAPIATPEVMEKIRAKIIRPTIEGMRDEGRLFRGCLYCGLMIVKAEPYVIEFNARFGDPETQVVVPLIDGDLIDLLEASARGDISPVRIAQHDATAVCVVMASNGYPDLFEIHKEIHGLETIDELREGVAIFHAGTTRAGERILTNGGRVLGVTAIGYAGDFATTITGAYNAVRKIGFDGAYYRSDIGARALSKR